MFLPKFTFLLVLATLLLHQAPTSAIKQTYIVYLGAHSHGSEVTNAQLDAVSDHHHELLGSYIGSTENARNAILYSYQYHINGFAATLEDDHAAEIAKHPDVVSVFPSKVRKLHTTHSWDFMLLQSSTGVISSDSLWAKARFGEDTIIANLDTGVWPESKSFSDEGYGPVPSRWRGYCQHVSNKTGEVPCNKKLIGAKYFNKGYIADGGLQNGTTRDYEGHGSHTLSTAGGNFVPGASVLGAANGTAKGGSPRARVASYKVCWDGGCPDADILKAFDEAIYDGVDVLSVSLGGYSEDFFSDGIALGAFHAVQNGVLVACSAGNDGPSNGTVENTAPWILTVGASTLDREFQSYVELKNGIRLKGTSLSSPMPDDGFYPLINAGDAKASNSTAELALQCLPGSLDPKKVKGKIVVCLRGTSARVDKGYQAAKAGAVGMILCNDENNGNDVVADVHFLPASQLTYEDSLAVFAYLNSTKNPLGRIDPVVAASNVKPAPVMAAFSSMGPSRLAPEILKPDITAPGVNIIAAYSEANSPTELEEDKRRTPYVTMSGTSMSCPHAAGLLGLLKSVHPDWSPSAIKSAIMTTARTRANDMHPIQDSFNVKATPFSYGSGHIRPNSATDPGLVYDMNANDYLEFLCAQGYNQSIIKMYNKHGHKCDKSKSVLDLNYPSIAIPSLHDPITVIRRLKNVGSPGTYAVRVRPPPGTKVSVEPKTLTFVKHGEEKSFNLTIEMDRSRLHKKEYVFGGLTWTDGYHYVRSPIVAKAVPKCIW